MSGLKLALLELHHFVFFEYFGFRKTTRSSTGFAMRAAPSSSVIATPVRAKADQLPERTLITAIADSPTKVFVVADKTHLFVSPVAIFDGVIAVIPYGSELDVIGTQHRWYEVVFHRQSGFVLRDSVGSDSPYPQFKLGQYYDDKNAETEKLRELTQDEFHGALIEAPLQGVEYVSYRLFRKSRLIPWGGNRPRLAGRWQQILRGQPGVYMDVKPKVDTVMQMVNGDGIGRVAFVESVFPDQSIVISEIGYPEEGQYSERTLTKDEWKEFRPVFIEVA